MLTIYTITYNRKDLLLKLYESIIKASRVTPTDFEWLVINNGSTDGTEEVLEALQKRNLITLRVCSIEANIGFTRADNYARSIVKREYSSRIDDDDIILDNYFLAFVRYEKLIRERQELCGIMFNCQNQHGTLLGSDFKSNYDFATDYKIYYTDATTGDKIRIYKSAIRDKYVSDVFDGELLTPTEITYMRMGLSYKHLCVNESVIRREYVAGGITLSESKSPPETNLNGFLLNLIELIRNPESSVYHRIKFRLHFIKRCFRCHLSFLEIFVRSKRDKVTAVMTPFAYLGYLCIGCFKKISPHMSTKFIIRR